MIFFLKQQIKQPETVAGHCKVSIEGSGMLLFLLTGFEIFFFNILDPPYDIS